MIRMWTRAMFVAAIGLVAGGAIGCAQERPPINRVQADALAKSFFVGPNLEDIGDDPEFYMRGTLVDTGYGAAQDGLFTSTYAQPLSRIRWEITEDTLNARLAYERIQGSDGKGLQYDGLQKKAGEDGQIVASYKIESHFDIRRDYNPTTGEETNVIVENSTDRPWYEREYFRVDWSQNLATDSYDFDTLSSLGWIGSIQYEPLSYTVLDPNSPDAPHFDADNGYFDVTVKAFAKPATIDLSSLGWGINTIPACQLPGEFAGGTQPYGNCNPQEITLRYSFKKVVDHDYEPRNFDGVRFNAIGAFTNDYYGYDREYGMVDAKWWRFKSGYNLWERSHAYTDYDNMTGDVPCATTQTTVNGANGSIAADPNRDTDGNGTADECESVTGMVGPDGSPMPGGSQCDAFKGKCTIPYRSRQQVTIPWYIAGDTNEDLFEATNWAVQEWDLALKGAIQSMRYVECKRTSGGESAAASCASSYPMWTGQQDDIDDAVNVARDLDACYRQNGYTGDGAKKCLQQVDDETAQMTWNPNSASIAAVEKIQPTIVLCHNPVIDSDNAACGGTGLAPRLGDIRYNLVLNIEKPQQPSAWGIMVDADDPISGEKVAASINIWTHITDFAAQGLVDLVRYVNGELKLQDITNGTYIDNWAQANKLAGGAQGRTMSREEITARLAAVAHVDDKSMAQILANAKSNNGIIQTKDGPMSVAEINNQLKLKDIVARNDIASPHAAMAQARMNMARGSNMEAQLWNQPMAQIAGFDYNQTAAAPLQGPLADLASPLALNSDRTLQQLRNMRELAYANRNACILDEEDSPEFSSIAGLAAILQQKFPATDAEKACEAAGMADPSKAQDCSTLPDAHNRYEAMLNYVRRRYHYAVLAHEMGHSVGLRHNFVSSSASLFYRPQYWQLRTSNGKQIAECTEQVTDGSKCTGPRYFDPLTQEEQDGLIWMWMQSTVMDYPGENSQDTLGLGVTDFAAARLFYGDTVSVYADKSYNAGTTIGTGISNATDTFGGLTGIQYGMLDPSNTQGVTTFHYSQLQKNYKVIDPASCTEVTPTQPSWWRQDIDGNWDPTFDGHVVKVDGKYTKCRQQPVDYETWNDLTVPTAKQLNNGFYQGGPAVDKSNRTRVPYAFASDDWADTGNVSVFRHDNGADPYEQVNFLITVQEDRHIFDNYRRGRSSFSIRAASGRSFDRYNTKLLDMSGGIGFYRTIYNDFGESEGYAPDSLFPFIAGLQFHENIIAATVAMDHFTRELGRPEPGPAYYLDAKFQDGHVLRSASDPDGNPGTTKVVIPNGSTGYLTDIGFGGHPIENALATDQGDYDVDYTENCGGYYDKINSAVFFSLSEDRFISQSRQDFYDARFRAVGMADVVPEGYRRIIANALTGDRSLLGPRVATNSSYTPILDSGASKGDVDRDPNAKMYPAQPMGWVSWWPSSGPVQCFPVNGSNTCADYSGTYTFGSGAPQYMAEVDPQVGWEVQKFIIAWTLAYIPADQKSNWLDMMRIYRLGPNADPAFDTRIEWQDPYSGQTYYAKTYGMECLFGQGTDKASCTSSGGKWVQKGIAARVLEWADFLTSKGMKLDTTNYTVAGGTADPDYGDGFNLKGRAMFLTQPDGTPVIVADPAISSIGSNGQLVTNKTCDQNVTPTCTPLTQYDNHFADQLADYKSVPDYLWETMQAYGIGTPDQLGVYPD